MRAVRVVAPVLVGLALLGGVAHAQERPSAEKRPPPEPREAREREHFQLKVGAAYDQGDFGTPDTSRAAYVPVTLRYLGERWDVAVTGALIHLRSESSVVVVDGVPVPVERRDETDATGFGDLVFKGRYFAVEDPGPGSPIPTLAPFVKVKVPTADEDEGLGTGEWDVGLGLEWDKYFDKFYLLGDLSYTFMGDPPDQNFRNRPGASIGAGTFLTPNVALTGLLDWRRAIVDGREDALELVALLQVRLSRVLTLTPNAFVGLTEGSPDFGVGIELSWRFGRY
jgi:hypothetical protein